MNILNNRGSSGLAVTAIVLAGAAIGVIASTPDSASAQAAYGSYIGGGVAVGVTSGDTGSTTGGLISFRYKFIDLPMSVRAQLLISDATAFVPTVSYDIPLSWQTDVYLGAGVAIQDANQHSSPIGNQTAFVIQPGIDYSLPDSNIVLFSNAIIAFDAYKTSNDTAASIQGGVGVRF